MVKTYEISITAARALGLDEPEMRVILGAFAAQHRQVQGVSLLSFKCDEGTALDLIEDLENHALDTESRSLATELGQAARRMREDMKK